MNLDKICNDNFLLFCAKHYKTNLCSSTEEFQEDINRIKYIQKLLTRYKESGILKERLILNHIIILSNVFSPEICCKILFFKLDKYSKYIKPFLIFLNILPEKIYNIGENEIMFTDIIDIDYNIVNILRKI